MNNRIGLSQHGDIRVVRSKDYLFTRRTISEGLDKSARDKGVVKVILRLIDDKQVAAPLK